MCKETLYHYTCDCIDSFVLVPTPATPQNPSQTPMPRMTRSQSHAMSTALVTPVVAPVCDGSRTRQCPAWHINDVQVQASCRICDEEFFNMLEDSIGESPEYDWGRGLAESEPREEHRSLPVSSDRAENPLMPVSGNREELQAVQRLENMRRVAAGNPLAAIDEWVKKIADDARSHIESQFCKLQEALDTDTDTETEAKMEPAVGMRKYKWKSKMPKAKGKGKEVAREVKQEHTAQEWYDTGLGRTMEEVLSVRGLGQKFEYRSGPTVTGEDTMMKETMNSDHTVKKDDTVEEKGVKENDPLKDQNAIEDEDTVMNEDTTMEGDAGMEAGYGMADEDWADLLA